MRYRRITTTGQIREKKKERRQSIYVWLIVIVILAILVGVGYLATPSTVLLQQTAFRGISYRPLMAFVMLFTAIFIIVIGILLADKHTKVGYYLKTIAFGIVIGMLFHGMCQSVTEYESLVGKQDSRTQRIQSNRNPFSKAQ